MLQSFDARYYLSCTYVRLVRLRLIYVQMREINCIFSFVAIKLYALQCLTN